MIVFIMTKTNSNIGTIMTIQIIKDAVKIKGSLNKKQQKKETTQQSKEITPEIYDKITFI